MILRRVDRRKDRVEISPDQLSSASTWAEQTAKQTGRPLRILGWYHSHPHITVWPSHVGEYPTLLLLAPSLSLHIFGGRLFIWLNTPVGIDLGTQFQYQMMEPTFIGLIISCFNQQSNGSQVIGLNMKPAQEGHFISSPQIFFGRNRSG